MVPDIRAKHPDIRVETIDTDMLEENEVLAKVLELIA